MYYSLDKRIWFTMIFLPLKECHSVPDMDFLIMPSLILSQLEISKRELPKLTPSIFIENYAHSICSGLSILFLYAPAYKAWFLKSLSLR